MKIEKIYGFTLISLLPVGFSFTIPSCGVERSFQDSFALAMTDFEYRHTVSAAELFTAAIRAI